MIHETLPVERELRRIGVHLKQLGGMSVSQPLSPRAFTVWLRSLPTGIGHEEFARRLKLPAEEGGPGIALSNQNLPVADPDYEDPELDEEIAFQREMDRVVWPNLQRELGERSSLGIDRVPDRRAALEKLRRLPNEATVQEVMAAMYGP